MKFLLNILLWVLCVQVYGQTFIDSKEFNKIKNSNQPFVVEFWAKFNDSNKWEELKVLNKCGVYRVCMIANKDLADEYNIKVLPTIIVFNNRKEIFRWKGNLLFEINLNPHDVQTKIDSLIMEKFR